MRILRRIAILWAKTLACGVLAIVLLNVWVVAGTHSRVYDDVAAVPDNKIALVLGTTPRIAGRPNVYFESRMDAAAALLKAGKVKHLLLSGDNSTRWYDEPNEMKKALLARGVVESCITLDFAGFRTLDSVVRARQVFGLDRLTVVSDDFHVPRALYLCDAFGIDAVALATRPAAGDSWRVWMREWLTRVKAVLDVHVLKTEPKYLGSKIDIDLDGAR